MDFTDAQDLASLLAPVVARSFHGITLALALDQWASTGGPASLQRGVGTCGVAASTNAVSARVSISRSSLRRETVHYLDDECPIERAGQRLGVREAKPGKRLGGVPGVPHHEHIVADYRYPVKPDIEVDALAPIVVLD